MSNWFTFAISCNLYIVILLPRLRSAIESRCEVGRSFCKKQDLSEIDAVNFALLRPLCVACSCFFCVCWWQMKLSSFPLFYKFTLHTIASEHFQAIRKLHADVIQCATLHEMHQIQYILIIKCIVRSQWRWCWPIKPITLGTSILCVCIICQCGTGTLLTEFCFTILHINLIKCDLSVVKCYTFA